MERSWFKIQKTKGTTVVCAARLILTGFRVRTMMTITIRRHGWQRPLHHLQIVGMVIFCLLVAAFYCFLGLFLGNKTAEMAVTGVFSFTAASAAALFTRCSSVDPSDKTRLRKTKRRGGTVKYGLSMLGQGVGRAMRRIERRILKTLIRRKYSLMADPPLALDSLPLMPFPHLVLKDADDSAPAHLIHPTDSNLSFCSLCDYQVHKHSKHCRTCNRCVEGFDHHCRWLNNCVGKKNYTTFILLMVFVLAMLIVEGGTALAIFIRCFADPKGIVLELKARHYINFPRGLLAAISLLLLLITAYSSAALGQLFFFHVLLIRKGMRTYDYILAMREENRLAQEAYSSEESDFSDDDLDDSPKNPAIMKQEPQKLSIRIEGESADKPQSFRASINPWKLVTMNQERALLAATKAKERQMMQNQREPLKPLPLETKTGPDPNIGRRMSMPPSPSQFSSPRRRFSSTSEESPKLSKETTSP